MPEPLQIGVVGCGRSVERSHLPALISSRKWYVRALCDPDPDRRRWAELAASGSSVFDSIDRMLDQVELDAVLIAAPPPMHVSLAKQALQRELHVLLEKPGGASLAEAAQLARLMNLPSRVFWIGLNRRFQPNYRAVREIVTAYPADRKTGRFELVISIDDWNPVSGYLGSMNRGGDVVYDLASHQVDLLAWMFSSPAAAVRCRSWVQDGQAYERLEYDLRLGTGVEIRCLAEHGKMYRERLTVEFDDTELVGYPTGLAKGKRGSWKSSDGWIAIRNRIERRLVGLRLRKDQLQVSYQAQLEAFAMAIAGEQPSVSGCDVNDLVMNHRVLEAISVNRNSPGKWSGLAKGS